MATAGLFLLLNNDGKQDKLIYASDFLRNRLHEIQAKNRYARKPDPTPTLLDIERTHILFVNAHYKQHVATSFEYVKISSEGAPTLGSDLRFSLPQYGDMLADGFVYIAFNQATYTPTVANPGRNVFRYCDYPGAETDSHSAPVGWEHGPKRGAGPVVMRGRLRGETISPVR
jgi:hypothetical protein